VRRSSSAGFAIRIRIAEGKTGELLYLTQAEHERERGEREGRRADAAEAELARLAAELESLRKRS
jgi:hypothetical protein